MKYAAVNPQLWKEAIKDFLEAIESGSQETLDKALEKVYRLANTYCHRLKASGRSGASFTDSSDLMQEIVLKVLGVYTTLRAVKTQDALQDGDEEYVRETVNSTIYGISKTALRTYIDECRKYKKENSFLDHNEMDEHANVASPISKGQAISEDLLRGLSPQEKEALYLKFVEEETIREIAKSMDVSRSTAHRLVHTAMRKIEQLKRSSSNTS
jgi:RNA polymerase sigma factor (sigma-70 family)